MAAITISIILPQMRADCKLYNILLETNAPSACVDAMVQTEGLLFTPVTNFNYSSEISNGSLPVTQFMADLNVSHVFHRWNAGDEASYGIIGLGFHGDVIISCGIETDLQINITRNGNDTNELQILVQEGSLQASFAWNNATCSLGITQQYTIADLINMNGTITDNVNATQATLCGSVGLLSAAYDRFGLLMRKDLEDIQDYCFNFPKSLLLFESFGTIGLFGTRWVREIIRTTEDITQVHITVLIENTIAGYKPNITNTSTDASWSGAGTTDVGFATQEHFSLPSYKTEFISLKFITDLTKPEEDVAFNWVKVTLKGGCPTPTDYYCPTTDECDTGFYCPVIPIIIDYDYDASAMTTFLDTNVTLTPTLIFYTDANHSIECGECTYSGGDYVYFKLGVETTVLDDKIILTLEEFSICGGYNVTMSDISTCVGGTVGGITLDYYAQVVANQIAGQVATNLGYQVTGSAPANNIKARIRVDESLRIAIVFVEFVLGIDINFTTRRRRVLLQASEIASLSKVAGGAFPVADRADAESTTDSANSIHLLWVVIVSIIAVNIF